MSYWDVRLATKVDNYISTIQFREATKIYTIYYIVTVHFQKRKQSVCGNTL